jgi:hypothetical protein
VLEAVEIRHRLTHISPMREFERALSDESAQVYTIRLPEVEKIIDSCIGLVRKLEKLIHPEPRRLHLHWLYDRTPDGMFPDAVFD